MKWLKRLLCKIGIHDMQIRVDEELTKEYQAIIPKWFDPSPCTYCECSRCGFSYNSRTIRFSYSTNKELQQ